jgi:hypothetical protein
MIKLNAKQQPLTKSYPPLSGIRPARRLIVPVSSPDMNSAAITRRIWDLAAALKADVKFVGLCTEPSQEPGIRRAVVTMAAMLNAADVNADVEIIPGKDWVNAVKSRCESADMVVCWDGQQTGWLRKPISQLLQPELNVPLYILSTGKQQANARSNWMAQIVAWIGFLTIIVGFLLLQIKIGQLSNDWTITLEIVSTAVEFWLIWGWNSLFG